jgi:hypothetical protein
MAENKTRKNQQLTRDTSNTPDPLDPSVPLVNRPPEYRDMNRASQNQVSQHVAEAGARAYGKPIQMGDAVRTRVNSIEAAIAEAGPSVVLGGRPGPVEGVDWYSGHMQELRDIHEESGAGRVSTASVADAAASASQRNSPDNEVAAVRSGLRNMVNPTQSVFVTPRHANAANYSTIRGKEVLDPEEHLTPGSHSIGNLNHKQIATLSSVALKTYSKDDEKKGYLPQGAKVGDVVHGDNPLPSEFTDVTGRVAGRETSMKVMDNLTGTPLSETWGAAPKLRSYRRGFSTANKPEDAYNASVIARRRDQQAMPGQGVLFSAAEETNFDPSTADTSTAEDYVMLAQTAHEAARRGGVPEKARDAQNMVKVQKGKRGEGITTDLTPDEARHAFNNEATTRAAKAINYSTFGPDGGNLSEHITNKAAQAVSWTRYRRHVLGEDKEWNEAQAQEAAREAERAEKAKKDAGTQGTLF